MGVAGSGKSTIGRALADELGWPYYEADDFHPPENVAKMSSGIPLTDEDRAPWLRSIRARMEACTAARQSAVFTCSALKATYRRTLSDGLTSVLLVYLQLEESEVLARIGGRQGHFMKADMVRSQFATLEVPAHALTIDARLSPPAIIARIRAELAR